MTIERYFDERSAALEAAGLDPEGDDWATPDNDIDVVAADRSEFLDLVADPWGDDEGPETAPDLDEWEEE